MWLTLGVATLLTLGGCSRRLAAQTDAAPHATITGTVRGPESRVSVHGRIVEIVNLDTQERHRLTTNDVGAFTVAVRPGKYKVELALRDGESLLESPGVMSIEHNAAGTHADFVVGTRRLSRPRAPVYRTDDGLGSPIA